MSSQSGAVETALVDSLAGAIRDNLLAPGEEKVRQLESRLLEEMTRERLSNRAGHEEISARLSRVEKDLTRLKYCCYGLAACALALAAAGYLIGKIF
ncbi:hypothetical protein [Desulfotomaculum copahuensis]|uniref:Uncharacterized protein n=1 Tax=Desulfotomaculum copahuensis TaxID=1838280 RepID=A0A1B7LDK4_9FIRM|nr:hypothetical protein [Desulfotomaculum copahuensis]OAT81188.1 hypothetical protein A6M21_11680 [Desulfotomaculum copahuensis]